MSTGVSLCSRALDNRDMYKIMYTKSQEEIRISCLKQIVLRIIILCLVDFLIERYSLISKSEIEFCDVIAENELHAQSCGRLSRI